MDNTQFLKVIAEEIRDVEADLERLSSSLVAAGATARRDKERLSEIRLKILKRLEEGAKP